MILPANMVTVLGGSNNHTLNSAHPTEPAPNKYQLSTTTVLVGFSACNTHSVYIWRGNQNTRMRVCQSIGGADARTAHATRTYGTYLDQTVPLIQLETPQRGSVSRRGVPIKLLEIRSLD